MRRTFARHVGATDVSGFMSELGYTGFDHMSVDVPTAFKLANSLTSPEKNYHQPLAQRALAEAAYKQLIDWSEQHGSGRSTWAMN